MMAAVLLVTVLLLLGVVLRLRFRPLQWLYVPASVIAGLLGLLLVQSVDFIAEGVRAERVAVLDSNPSGAESSANEEINSETQNRTESEASPKTETPQRSAADTLLQIQDNLDASVKTLSSWPSFLIALVFAGMLLERKPAPIRDSISQVGRQGLMVWIIVLGQTAVGLIATWLLIQPSFDLPNSFGVLIETGFAGGHGTAAAMGKVYSSDVIGLDSGLDLGILMATCGLVYGIITGILWINIGVRSGWVRSDSIATNRNNGERSANETPIGYAKIGSETIDPLLLQIIWLALAVGVGMAMQALVASFATSIDTWRNAGQGSDAAREVLSTRLSAVKVLDFPLFIYTLFGGLIVRKILRAAGHEKAVDRETINRLTSTAMDLLVVAAITSLNLAAVASLIVPFSILFVCGAIWCGVCLLILSRLILPHDYWFQLGLINYGMSTGTTATGFVLLRVVDPELESGAAEDYALAAPLSSPFVGGGMITVALPLLLLERVPIAIPALTITALVAAMIFLGIRWNRSASAADLDHAETKRRVSQ